MKKDFSSTSGSSTSGSRPTGSKPAGSRPVGSRPSRTRPPATRPYTANPTARAPAEKSTAWQEVGKWYDDLVGPTGHYYHQHVILPNALRILKFNAKSRLLDLGCGQGVLARSIPKDVDYVGVDLSKKLLQAAKAYHSNDKKRAFFLNDITQPLKLPTKELFSHATLILSLQNVENGQKVFEQLRSHLLPSGQVLIVLNHPTFRIPRQSGWGFDEPTKSQYRKITSYMTPQKIPIQMHPGKNEENEETWSFHHPLSDYSQWLKQSGFVIESIEEWCSDKESTGKAAKWENRARKEFPLFLAIVAKLA